MLNKGFNLYLQYVHVERTVSVQCITWIFPVCICGFSKQEYLLLSTLIRN